MSIFYVIVISLIVFFSLKRKKNEEPQSDERVVYDEEGVEEMFLSKEEEIHREKIVAEKADKTEVKQQVEKDEIKTFSDKQEKEFSLREAVIYSSILERPYK